MSLLVVQNEKIIYKDIPLKQTEVISRIIGENKKKQRSGNKHIIPD